VTAARIEDAPVPRLLGGHLLYLVDDAGTRLAVLLRGPDERGHEGPS